MRKHAASWLIKILLIAVALSFVVWGGYRYREQQRVRIASVNGESITIGEYRESYNTILQQLQRSFGNNLNAEMLKMLQVEKQALDRLINQKLLLQEASRLHFDVSDEELSDTIRNMEPFQQAGMFNARRYRLVLDSIRLSPEDFEAIQKESILVQKLNSFISDTVKVSDLEAWDWYKWQNASIDIDTVSFNPDTYDNIEPTAEEVEKYFNDNKEAYKTEPKIKTGFLYFNPADYADKVKLPQEEIDLYYDENPDEFKTPKTVEARHILFKLEQDVPEADVEKAKQRALDVMKLAREGKDFAELAKEHSEGPTKDQGGYLGSFRKEAMVKPFSDMAFSMKAGEISEPVRTQFGWHIINVEKVNEASTEPKAKAEEKIRKKLTEEYSKTEAFDHAESVYETIFDGDDLKTVAEDRKLKYRTTDFFTQKGPDADIQSPAQFAATAFKLSEMQISEIADLGDGFYILQVIEKMPSNIPELDHVKDDVRADLVKEKQREKAKADATTLLEAVKGGKSMSEAGKGFELTPQTTGLFKRNASIPNIGYEPSISSAAFKLSEKKPLPEAAVNGQNKYYVIRFKERKEPERSEFEKEKDSVKLNLLRSKQRKAFDAWVSELRDSSDITVEDGFLSE